MSQGKIKNADIATGAAIDRTKLAAGTTNGVVVNDSSGAMTSVAPGASGNVLTSNGTSWASSAAPSGLPTATNAGDLVVWNGTAWVAQRPGGAKAPPIRILGGAVRLYCDGLTSVGSAGSLTSDQIRGDWFTAPYTGTINKIGINATGVAGAVGRLLIYSLGTDGYPLTRVVDSGELSFASTGVVSADVSVPVTAGVAYLLAIEAGTPAPSVSSRGGGVLYGIRSSTGTLVLGLQVAQAYGPGPATFPSGAFNISSFASVPAVFVEYAP